MRGVIVYTRYAKRAHTKIFEYTTKWGSCTAYLLYEAQFLSVSKQDYVCERELYCLTFARFLLTSDVSPHSGTLSRFQIDITWGQNYLVSSFPIAYTLDSPLRRLDGGPEEGSSHFQRRAWKRLSSSSQRCTEPETWLCHTMDPTIGPAAETWWWQ
jgi:hypothetical protein